MPHLTRACQAYVPLIRRRSAGQPSSRRVRRTAGRDPASGRPRETGDGVADLVDNALDEVEIVALAHDPDDRLGAGGPDDETAGRAELLAADSIARTTAASSSGLPALTLTLFRICGNGSKRWQTWLTGFAWRLTTASNCRAATRPSPVVQ